MQKLGITRLMGLTVVAANFGVEVAAGNGAADMDSCESNRPVCTSIAGATATSRHIDWDGSDHVGLSVGGHASYTRGGDDQVHASGDPRLLANLTVRKGDIKLDCKGRPFDTSNLMITLPGREFRIFGIAGTADLSLHKLDQQEIYVAIAGSGSIKAEGRVDHGDINMAGSGNADPSRLAMQVAKVHIAGSDKADIAPSEEANIQIVGSGNVDLHTRPSRVERHVLGSGRLHYD